MQAVEDRIIRSEFWHDDRVRSLDPYGRLLFLWLIACADRDGIAPFDVKEAQEVIAVDTPGEMREIVSDLVGSGLVAVYGEQPTFWAWIPMLPVHQPTRGNLAPSRDTKRPAPPPEVVGSCLHVRMARKPTEKECRDACPRAFGKKAKPVGGPATGEVRLIWEAWSSRQQNPDLCKLSPPVRTMIRGALEDAAATAIAHLIQYAYEANEAGPRYWRGENQQRRTYLGLDNLLNRKKLQSRVQMASKWKPVTPEEKLPPLDALKADAIKLSFQPVDADIGALLSEMLQKATEEHEAVSAIKEFQKQVFENHREELLKQAEEELGDLRKGMSPETWQNSLEMLGLDIAKRRYPSMSVTRLRLRK